eukprot:TRINITY_DN4726_c1_g1_i3.p1 TRINITY_DN4726_c1_g1~~TRINITY_DN4726_c1_g1_i3.p1  ORF type:complete len:521 (+),score=81.36 TRINITY_DN4726_c1_g1_i3:79-1641(+)
MSHAELLRPADRAAHAAFDALPPALQAEVAARGAISAARHPSSLLMARIREAKAGHPASAHLAPCFHNPHPRSPSPPRGARSAARSIAARQANRDSSWPAGGDSSSWVLVVRGRRRTRAPPPPQPPPGRRVCAAAPAAPPSAAPLRPRALSPQPRKAPRTPPSKPATRLTAAPATRPLAAAPSPSDPASPQLAAAPATAPPSPSAPPTAGAPPCRLEDSPVWRPAPVPPPPPPLSRTCIPRRLLRTPPHPDPPSLVEVTADPCLDGALAVGTSLVAGAVHVLGALGEALCQAVAAVAAPVGGVGGLIELGLPDDAQRGNRDALAPQPRISLAQRREAASMAERSRAAVLRGPLRRMGLFLRLRWMCNGAKHTHARSAWTRFALWAARRRALRRTAAAALTCAEHRRRTAATAWRRFEQHAAARKQRRLTAAAYRCWLRWVARRRALCLAGAAAQAAGRRSAAAAFGRWVQWAALRAAARQAERRAVLAAAFAALRREVLMRSRELRLALRGRRAGSGARR